MTAESSTSTVRRNPDPVVRWVTLLGGLVFLLFGAWGFVEPRSFFDAVAVFEPYNAHFVRDIGAFQFGLGAVLVLIVVASDAHAAALLGVAAGSGLHAVGHVIDRELGGTPATDIPTFAVIALVLAWAGYRRLQRTSR